ncbi:non-ribosomal peptide synthetase [Pseudomonas vancouverensis]|uniref:Non-ribosomal peptide synthetase n=1 Tax=Pseudomonas vancouverensis TaxID=95300 RepID=A0A1H2MIR0_PSEVA|nr:non-ribosomal peptide synthetase [Pseudomonas vancouverensis]KAB0494815.1 non-ribosomal peptide synthetase [Pseudomonas vancouverensis]TDB63543.1 non-ribosomal peptide synthetase [Pseudomonas vancouverensis]SDU93133.1 non-ribosomal peptide synthase domain TIGR01720/amino acid adenylation domain-containing protein [Pseudomonas vancouverensis]
MNAEDALKLARRFIGLPLEKRQMFLAALAKEGVDFARFPIPAGVEAEDRQAVSYAQQRMWFLWQLEPHSGAYNLPGAVRLSGRLNRSALEQAFASLVARHETLRTVFQRQPDDSLLQVPATAPLLIETMDLTALAKDERERAVAETAQQQSMLPFDLAVGPLLRVTLLKLAEQEHVLLLTLHHIVSDGWSMNVLIDEFVRCYDAFDAGAQPQLAPLPIQYSDYALWQRRWLEAGEQARQLDYWQQQLGDEHPVLELPLDHARPAIPSYRGTRYEFAIDGQLAEQLRSTAQQHNVTLFMLLLGAFNVLLHRYTGQNDIRVGVPIANRNRAEVEGLIGFFVNTQVLRTQLDGHTRVDELLRATKETALGAQAHQDLPFERLVDALKLERSLSHTPLFQVMYNHQPQVADMASVSSASGLVLGSLAWQSRTTQFDLTLDTWEKGGKLHAALTYASDLFEAATIARMAEHWTRLLQAMVTDSSQRIGELPMLSADEQRVLVHDWNRTAQVYPVDQSVHQLIEAQARRTPEAPALVFGERQLSYGQLEARANQLAHCLREQGVGPDVLVGICVERSLEMVIGLLAILKAGGAYVPLDPEYPAERLAYMIEDSAIGLLLTQSALLEALPTEGVKVLILDQAQDWLANYSETCPQVAVHPLNLAYVIYTSGSTGKPKGAGNSHGALVNRLCWMQQAYAIDGGDSVLQKTPFSFDVSVWEFFWPLMTGARLVVAPPGAHREPARLIQLIGDHNISTLHFVPSMLQAFIHEPGVEVCTGLKRIMCSGEALPLDAQLHVFAKLPNAGLFNLYGPTEAAIDVTHWTCVDEGVDSVPIGRAIANLRTHVLDARLMPVPAGVAGELYLGGAGLARSYHRRPALTAERFVPCPFHDGARLYRTGDRVRQRADGVIEYLGRLDHQVKLRGLRIELGEIETRLMQHPRVREAVVLVQGGKQLVAYLLLENAEPDPQWPQTLKAWLLGSLPEFMVPTCLMALDAMPVTANGKLDRKALPQPDAAPEQAFVAPQDAMQVTLAQIWQDVLGLERVGLEDNFFELGGDSIISIQVVSRARQAGIRLSPRDLFQYQTVRSLALVAVLEHHSSIDQGPVSGEVPLTPAQHYFFEQAIAQRQHWNQSLLLTPRAALDPGALEAALVAVINHHDALRLRFIDSADGWQQRHTAPVETSGLWQRHGVSTQELTALCDEAQRSLDLADGPLLRALLVNLEDGSQRLLLVVHHLVVDGVSWRVLLEDLQRACTQAAAGQPVALPAKTSAYQAWATQLQQHARTLDEQLPYWQAQVADAQDLPCDNPQGSLEHRHGHKIESKLDAELTRQLLQRAPAAYRTQVNDLLLTALARVICRWSGQGSTLIQLEGHGREDLSEHLDLTRTLGWFTSLFPVRLQPAAETAQAIKSIKEQLRAIPGKGLGYGVLRYLAEPAQREALQGLPTPRITFNYLGQFDRQFDDQALFVPASENGGQAQGDDAPLANWLTLEGQVYGGQLSLQWGFSRDMFADSTVQQLADAYVDELKKLIEHCCTTAAGQVTPSDFPLARITQAQLDALPVAAPAIEDLYPLTPMQQGMLFHTLYEPQAEAYINQLRLEIHGLDLAAFGRAWQAAINRHDILRSSFHWLDLAQAHQVIHRQIDLQLQVIEANAIDLDALAGEERSRGFELSTAPLFRLLLVKQGGEQWHLIYTSHHILMDGWSNAQLLGEVIQHYAGQTPSKPVGQYRDYLAWLAQHSQAAGEQFWKHVLTALETPTLLAQALPAPNEGQGMGEHQLTLDSAALQRLSDFARQQKVTLNTLIQGAWSLLLQRYTGQTCVAFGATVAGRSAPLPGIEQQLGLFINTLPIIAAPTSGQTVAQWLDALQAQNLSLREFEHVPLYDIQNWAGHQGALFDSLLVFENFPVAEALKQGAPAGLTFGALHNHEITSYPLTLGVEAGGTLRLDFSFNRSLFSAAQISRMGASLLHVLEQFVAQPQQTLGAIGLLDADAQAQVLRHSRPPAALLDSPLLAHQRFEQQAARTPHALAIIAGDERLTYGQLNARANQLAHRLRAQGVAPGQRVGLSVRRSARMIVSLMAILKAGAGYVPLDPDYPAERLAYMIEDSGMDLLLAQSGLLAEVVLPEGLPCLSLDASVSEYATDNLANLASTEDLAYLIYTSGSTGRPKGVCLTHAALREFCVIAADYSQLTAQDRVLQFATFSFDGFVEQCYPPLCVGAALVMRGDELWDTETLYRQIIEQGVTLADLPAAYWFLLAQDWAAQPHRDKGRLRQVHVGGEAMSLEGLKLWHAAGLGDVRLLNTYGPTEATVVSSIHPCTQVDSRNPLGVPIGKALPGRALYVLDSEGHLLPDGCVGELCIGGDAGLAQRYHQRPGLSAERFIADPFSTTPGARLYRSGDLARYREDGVLQYLGRIDHQVKIRGFRVELGELEAHLQALPMLNEAAVLVHEGAGGKQLIGYVVVADEHKSYGDARQLTDTVRRALGERLPDYMLPTQLVLMAALPLNRNGKLDRAALPAPELWEAASGTPPHGGLETQLAQIWQQVLQVSRVDRENSFFELGGHSLLATQIVSQIRQQLGLSVSLRCLFEHPCLVDFATQVQALQPVSERPALLPDTSGERQPLSFAQQRLWFLWNLEPDSSMYNMPGALRLRGELNLDALRQTFDALVQRHAVLRTTFYEEHGQAWQRVHPQLPLDFVEVDLRALLAPDVEAQRLAHDEVARPFDLRHGPLLRIRVLRLADQEHVLLLTVHHIAADDASFRVLINEFVTLYPRFSRGQTPQLPAQGVQYADFARWQRQWLEQGGELQRQLDYWQQRLGEPQAVLELPADGDRRVAAQGATAHFTFSRELSAQLRDFARQHDLTLFMLLLGGFTLVLHQRTQVDRVRIGTDIANRNHAGLEEMLGFFVNQLVLQLDIDAGQSAGKWLDACRRTVLEASDHQDLPFERLVEALRLPRRAGRSPLFDIKLIYQEGVGRLPSMDGLLVEDFPSGRQAAEIGMVAAFYNDAEHVHLSFETAAGQYLPSTLACLSEQIQAVLQALMAEDDRQIGQLLELAADVQRRADLQLSEQRRALLGTTMPIRRRPVNRGAPTAAD